MYGTVQAQVGDRVVTAGPRDIIWKPRGIPHAFWNPGPERALILELITPGGFEGYFRELVALAHASNGSPDRERMQEIQSRYGLQMDLSSMNALVERYRLRLPRM